MVNNPLFLVLGILLLWFPRRWMRLGTIFGRRKRKPRREDEPWVRREPGDPRLNFGRELRKPRNYFDLLRATTGGLAVVGGDNISPSLHLPDRVSADSVLIYLGALLLLTIGLLIQTYRNENGRMAFFAPVLYLAGLSVCLVGTWSAVFAFILIWALNPMLRNPQAFLAVYALIVTGFGLALGSVAFERPIVAFFLFLLPVLLSLMTRRPLIVFSRKGFRVGEAG
ncbi:MAG: hypothetical protein RIQ93_2987 [Verrucomicrobiota bacterium]|jgi:hypothetical protein